MEQQRRIPWVLFAIWLLTSAPAALSCSLNYSATRYQNEHVPVGNDAFYHARRIVDTVSEMRHLFELTAAELDTEAPQIKCALIRPRMTRPGPDGTIKMFFWVKNPHPVKDSLLAAKREVSFAESSQGSYARLYQIRQSAPAVSTPTAGTVA